MKNTVKEDKLQIGVRDKAENFTFVYQQGFLEKHGLNFYSVLGALSRKTLITVQTKYGELVIDGNTMITYLGNNKWDARKE